LVVSFSFSVPSNGSRKDENSSRIQQGKYPSQTQRGHVEMH
jgi:hypothetical protein